MHLSSWQPILELSYLLPKFGEEQWMDHMLYIYNLEQDLHKTVGMNTHIKSLK